MAIARGDARAGGSGSVAIPTAPRFGYAAAAQPFVQPDPLRRAALAQSAALGAFSPTGPSQPTVACRLTQTLGCTIEEAVQCSSKVSAFGVSRTSRRGRAAKHWPAPQASSSGALHQPKTKDDQHLGSCEQRALRHQRGEAAAAHVKARPSPCQPRTRSVIGCNGALRLCFNPQNYARAATSGGTARSGGTFMACSWSSSCKPTTSQCSLTIRSS